MNAAVLRESIMTSWVQGFLYGVGAGGGTVGFLSRIPDGSAIESWLDSHCREKPLEKLDEAATTLVVELKFRQR